MIVSNARNKSDVMPFNKRVTLYVVLASDFLYVGYSSSTSTKLTIRYFMDITQMKMIPKLSINSHNCILYRASREGPAAPDGPPL